ncbi:hypothetical protein PENSPDRAFT_594814 [Peniophora sp. CONT]|nr:hypothetical protein PENSPDRAFT_594814 [Peniophora sp. CONT]
MVARTDGFYARDYSLWLGWNNMRYIIDAAFIQARMLNRTLILPSFVYARACEYSLDVCADFADMVNRGDAMNDDQWREMPYEDQMGYRIPLPIMLNVTAMRAVHPVILVSDYLRYHGLPADIESGRGQWDRSAYHTHAPVDGSASGPPDLFVVQNGWYDPTGISRVDVLPEDMKARGGWTPSALTENGTGGQWEEREEDDVAQQLRAQFELFNQLDWDRAVQTLRLTSAAEKYALDKDDEATAALWASGWEVLHTFKGVHNSDLSKAVIEPTRDVAQRSQIRAWKDDYSQIKARVLLLEGETHNGRKAGAMRFTTTDALKNFQRDVLYHLQPTQPLQDLALELANRMAAKVEGRLWMGAHMRRGDFVGLDWVTSSSPAGHMMTVKRHLITGQRMLEDMHGEPQMYDIPDVQINTDLQTRPAPQTNDPFYVATDERDPDALKLFREQGAILLPDLLSMTDRRLFGWPIMLTDVRAIVEQELLSHSAFFTGTHISSVSGGILNMRAAHGADRRSIAMD